VNTLNDPSDDVSRKKFRGGLGISGFSLIEIALALGIISFAGIAILGCCPPR
jgi:type II secretory pathway pseudopilin PulG